MRFLSHFSMAVALAAVGALAITAVPQEAQAAKKKKQKGPKNSKEFTAVIVPVQTAMEGEDPASAKPLMDNVLAQPWTGYDQFVAGQFAVNLGVKLKDQGLQEKGLSAMVASGFAPAEQMPVFNFYLGNFAFGSERWGEAEHYFQAAYDLGYRGNNFEPLLAETFFKRNMTSEGLAKWDQIINDANASQTKPQETWYRLARDRALASGDMGVYATWAAKWASAYPSGDSWGDAVAATRRTLKADSTQNLELLRFMKTTGALKTSSDYKEYAEEAQRKNLFGEVVAVLEEGLQNGTVGSSHPLIAELLAPARREVSADKASLPAQPSGVRGSGSSSVMMNFADVWLGYKDFDKAVDFYEAGLAKPGADLNRGYMGVGTAQAYAGDFAAAKQAFSKVSGPRAPLAGLWQTWIGQQTAPAAPAAATAEPAS